MLVAAWSLKIRTATTPRRLVSASMALKTLELMVVILSSPKTSLFSQIAVVQL